MSERFHTIPEVLNLALAAFKAGDSAHAERLCEAVVTVAPHSFGGLHLLAIIQSSSGQGETALENFRRALNEQPLSAEAWNNLGTTLHDLARFEEALASFDRALAIRPDYAEALYNSGNSLRLLERFEAAIERYARALAIRPDDAEALNNQGAALHALGRFEEALHCYDRALARRADFVEAVYNRGSTLHRLHRLEAALASYDTALAAQPDLIEAHINRGNVLRDLNRFDKALASYDGALAIAPDNIDALNNRGQTLADLKRFGEAIENYDTALAIRPDFAEALNNRGNCMKELGRFEEAFASFDRALAARPDFAEALCNRGLALKELGRLQEALDSYDEALALQPDYAKCGWNKALSLLLGGSFDSGWRGYEWRRKRESWVERALPGPEWTGGDPAGRRLLFYAEQGLGDAIQFSRFARSVAAAGGEVFLEVRPCLAALMRTLGGVSVIGKGAPLPAFDAHLPLMSLPHVLAPTMRLTAEVPYLAAEPQRVRTWTSRLPAGDCRIGIVWQGNPCGEVDKGRSIPLRAFAPLGRVPGVSLISLQKNDGVEQLAGLASEIGITPLGNDFDAGNDAFLDSAAAIMALDLVICCDTAIAHLAGALGRPVWIVLKHVPDWRWMMHRSDSPWYPTARLFRQNYRDDWDEVFGRIADEVALMTARREMAAA